MIYGVELFFSLFNNLAIFIALVAIYSYLLVRFKQSSWYRRQFALGLSFGIFAIGCMYAKIPVFEGVIVDQRNAIIVLSGAFGGPLSAMISAAIAGAFRIYLGGDGTFAGVIGLGLAAIAGIGLNRFRGRFDSMQKAAVSALIAVFIILPGFLFVGDMETGWKLMKTMTLPYGGAIFLGIFLVGLLLKREEDRYQAELSFRESEEKYRDLIEGTDDLITHSDGHGHITFVNHVATKMLGIGPEQCIGISAFQFVHPDDREKTLEWFNNCVANKTQQAKIENRQLNTKTGKSHNVLWLSSFHYDDSGGLIGVGGIARDITEIRVAEQNYKSLFDKMPDGYCIFETIFDENNRPVDYRFLSINPAYERITGFKANDLIGKTLLELFSDKAKHWIEIVSQISLSGEPKTFEYFSSELNKHLEMTAYTLLDNRLACIFQDITLRKKAEQENKVFEAQLRQTQKMEAIGTLSGGIAHDFNNILAAILGYAEMARDDVPGRSSARRNLNEVLKAGNRAKNLVKQILAFSRKAEQSREAVEVRLLIQETLNFIRATIPTTIRIESNIDPDCGSILADPTQIHQVLMNLCTNAFHAMEDEGGVLRVDVSVVELIADQLKNGSSLKPGAYLLLSVIDTGVGIKEEQLERIFEPYFTTKEFGKGSGMGLSVVHGIVKSHDGLITVESMPGKGTSFNLYFPRCETATDDKLEYVAPLPGGKEKILIIDDDASIAGLTKKRLQTLGYQATVMTSSLDALEIFRSDPNASKLRYKSLIML
ncbi:MAG: PAS domain S-box protein [Gammaproteobacteria bacterium]